MLSNEQFSQVLHEWVKVFMRRTGQEFKHFMDDSGLSFSQVSTLMRLHYSGRVDVSDVAEQMGITNAAASQLVDRLVQMGLLERMEDSVDRRIKRLTLTTAGHELSEKLVETRRRWMERFTNSLTSQQRESISTALQIMTDAARKIDD
jgi:DNA-binding MarR family transcriptional regulator